MKPFLFVTDLDNTLIGDDAALATLNQKLEKHRQENGTKIVYATGRSLYLYRQLAQEKTLLTPDALIASVGTAIFSDPQDDAYDPQWAEVLSPGWNREKILEIGTSFTQLVPQPEYEQFEYKVSYHIPEAEAKEVMPALQEKLTAAGLKFNLIYSGSLDLDVLPENGNKGLAVKFLQEKLGFQPEDTVVCGDSGNDIALFKVGKSRGIMVGNSKHELREWYQANRKDYHYLAQSSCSGGILEGLKHFKFL
ncbi:MAG: sucrose-phosphate phosphatase [Spirulinaceae cyanobacterium]